MMSCDFQDSGRQPRCICYEVMADHPESVFDSLSSLVGQINSSGDIVMYTFRCS